ncbi:hypothetical protein [Oceanidesulfovibrio marinus]|uniref:Uncharacterized protein n=1 Tax=Oceanidesulfovibrio marinus TaxID=370038 RepID=A0ABX6NF32_9BACT|nr:hypothetical protein [Oceanidesulfovibrio marinus]QJT09240.1 hypothetical protein E8L03_09945 [Oceanidesulfovibrio marinus]
MPDNKHISTEVFLAQRNYKFEKRQNEMAKKKKKKEKAQRKLERKQETEKNGTDAPAADDDFQDQ